MGWFSRKTEGLETRLALLEGKLAAAHALSFSLMLVIPEQDRLFVLETLKRYLGSKVGSMIPARVLPENQQAFRDEFSRALQIYIESLEKDQDPEPSQSI